MTSTSLTAWLLAGFTASLLDYSFAAGFGLIASLVLSGILGYDPRSVAGAAALAQLFSALPVLTIHHKLGNISARTNKARRVLGLFAFSALLASLGFSIIATGLPKSIIIFLYSVLLLVLALILYKASLDAEDPPTRSSYWVAVLYGTLAGAYKALIGGGYSALVVLAQRRLGLDLRSAIAIMPLVKLPAFTMVALIYILSGHLDPRAALMLTLGALVATPIAAHMLHKTRATLTSRILAITIALVALAKVTQVTLRP